MVDIPEYYFANYTEGVKINGTTTYPAGLLIKARSNSQFYLITPEGQRLVSEEGMKANHLQARFALELDEPLDLPFSGTTIEGFEYRWGSPDELKNEISKFIDFYNKVRYHEALENVTPDDVYFGRKETVLTKRQGLKEKTLNRRKELNNRRMKESGGPA